MPDADPSLATKPRPRIGLKIIVVAACGVILSLGMCGVGFYFDRTVYDGAPPTLAILGGITLLLSVIALAVGVLLAITEAISNSTDKRKP